MADNDSLYARMSERELWDQIQTLELLIDLDPSSREVGTLIQLRELAKSYYAERTGYYPLSHI